MANNDKRLNRDDLNRLREYVIAERDHFENYHKRKENSVWLAVTGYLGILIGVASTLLAKGCILPPYPLRWVAVVAIVALLIPFLAFIAQQQRSRQIAGSIVASCGIVLTKVMDPKSEILASALRATKHETSDVELMIPSIVKENLRPLRPRVDIQWNYLFPIAVLIISSLGLAIYLFFAP